LVIQNEDGAVLSTKIVPSDAREYVLDQLEKIWTTHGRKVETKCIYTDNARMDTNLITASYLNAFPSKQPPAILQVL
jgi:hypothetical protein